MKSSSIIKINFRGGIISPGGLLKILEAAQQALIGKVSFGSRQQLLIQVTDRQGDLLTHLLDGLDVSYERNADNFPNVVSSYPAEEIFITKTWLTEGVYKDVFDLMDFTPRLKINLSNSNQSFTPILTGNINWVASPHSPHFWHLFIRFPKTNKVYEWNQLVYTNDITRLSKLVEAFIFANEKEYYDNPEADGNVLFENIPWQSFITKKADSQANLPTFNLPYYEGLNRYNDKYWLGIYRRNELFDIAFLKDICRLCLETKVGQLCATSWKSILVKGIEEKHRSFWNAVLALHRINVRHAANELNFQVEDHCSRGLALKNYLVQKLSRDDMRTFGICIGIKTRKKSEVFSSILVRERHLFTVFGRGFFSVYDILCAKDFNPNERTGEMFSSNTPKFLLPGKFRKAIRLFFHQQATQQDKVRVLPHPREEQPQGPPQWVYQCKDCLTIYDPSETLAGIDEQGSLPVGHFCSLCEAPAAEFRRLEKAEITGEEPL